MQWQREKYLITTDADKVDIDVIHQYLSEQSYWAKGIPREIVAWSVQHSICFSVLHEGALIGFARVTSDHATVAYVGDVFVLPAHRGRGLSTWLMECVIAHPDLRGLRRWMLATADAHGLYARFGFAAMKAPERWMEKHDLDVYKN